MLPQTRLSWNRWGTLTAIGVIALAFYHGQSSVKGANTVLVPQELRIAVVDLNEVFRSWSRTQKLSATLNNKGQALKEWRASELSELKSLKSELLHLKPGSDAFKETVEKIRQREIEIDVSIEVRTKYLRTDQVRMTLDVYQQVLRCVEQVAREKGLALVLRKDNPPNERDTLSELQIDVQNHKVLFADKTMDITTHVLSKLESQSSR